MNPSIRLKKASALFFVVLGCFALSSIAQAVNPPPDGGYPNNNTAEGDNALFSLTTGAANTAIGFDALFSLTTGGDNTAIGFDALGSNTTGLSNTAIGFAALGSNTTGNNNTANGDAALTSNTTGSDNTANGAAALQFNTTGGSNTANGDAALESNTTGIDNTATGALALESNTTGNDNTATGSAALLSNTTGGSNTANGFLALLSNTTGGSNTANGFEALESNTTGSGNTANGFQALFHNTIGSNNIALGSSAGSTLTIGSNNIDIGNVGVAAESATIRIGTVGAQTKTFIAGIHGAVVTGVAVKVNVAGQLGVAPSSKRFKDEIRPMGKSSEAIFGLNPVTFRYKKELDPEGIPQFGLVAEDVEKVNPDLVGMDNDGKPYTVRYDAVNTMLLNEFLKEHCKVESLEKAMAEQQKENAAMRAMLKEQAAQIQQVSAQLEVSRSAPKVADRNY
jgi:hypothetical protein